MKGIKPNFNHIENATRNECNQNATKLTALSRERTTKSQDGDIATLTTITFYV